MKKIPLQFPVGNARQPTALVPAGLAGCLLAVLVACGDGTSSVSGTPPPGPTCQSGTILYDTGGTNGFGRVPVTDASVPNFEPIDIAFIPGTSAFVIASKGGYLHYFNGSCTPVNAVDLRATLPVGSTFGEQGLQNIEFHPDYANNHFLFAYHTSINGTVNSVSRLTVSLNGSGSLVISDVVRIIDFRRGDPPDATDRHNGGGLVFAPDGSLLASVGDGGANSSYAQDNGRLLGKVIRILPNLTAGAGGFTIPSGNMFSASNTSCTNVVLSASDCPEILAKGLRNPFRMSIDGDIVYIGDVGGEFEEINSLGYTRNTFNFGWPVHSGTVASSSLPGYRNPIVAYRRNVEGMAFLAEDPMATDSGSASIMVGTVYHGLQYAGLLEGRLLFGDFYDGYNRYVGVAAGTDGNGEITDNDGVPGSHLVHENAITSYVSAPDGFIYMTSLYDPPAVYRLVRP